MPSRQNPREMAREKRKKRIRKNVQGTTERPRLCVFRSQKHIYAQVIDDIQGITLASASTLSPDYKELESLEGKVAAAKQVGMLVAQKAQAEGISKVVFDRNGYIYHGRVQALADGAREAGLDF
jgi:large subunit ribosomal protein L18